MAVYYVERVIVVRKIEDGRYLEADPLKRASFCLVLRLGFETIGSLLGLGYDLRRIVYSDDAALGNVSS